MPSGSILISKNFLEQKDLYTITSYILIMEQTTIQISKALLERLRMRKMSEKESYEEVVWDLIEDTTELSEETKKAIAVGRKQVKEGKTISLEAVKKKYGIR